MARSSSGVTVQVRVVPRPPPSSPYSADA